MECNRRQFLTASFAAAMVPWGRAQAADSSARPLREIFPAFGTAVRGEHLTQDPEYAALVAQQCGLLTPENALKWGVLRPQPDVFNFAEADVIAEFAAKHQQQMRGHTLAWYRDGAACPWLAAALKTGDAAHILRDHITTVMSRYVGKIFSWDVVNEPIDATQPNGLRRGVWYDALGEDYIALAYRTAHEVDKNALLVLNETGIEYDEPRQAARRQALLALIDRLQAQHVPLHAIGLESHLILSDTTNPQSPWYRPFNAEVFTQFVAQIHQRGLQVMVTELDVNDRTKSLSTRAERDAATAQHVTDYLASIRQAGAVLSVQCWGMSDRYSWLHDNTFREDGARLRPLPFDRSLNAKPFWPALRQALSL